jgi:hypothetical protein
MTKPEFIQYLELQEGVFSILKFHRFEKDIVKYFDDKSYPRVYETGVVSITGKAKWVELIFKSTQDFYLHFKLSEENEEYSLDIYYKPEKRNELMFFTSKILKPFIEKNINIDNSQIEN